MRAVVALVAVLSLAACTTSHGRPAPTPPSHAASAGWHELALPATGARVMVLTPFDGGLLALGSVPAPAGRAPAAWTTTDATSWHRLALHPVTGYGQQAEFVMAGVAGMHIAAYGQAFGGAHSNARPTLWEGGTGGLTEHEQVFTLFGGEHAIATSDEAARPGQVLLAGSWDEAGGGYGAAVWTSPDGATWTRYADVPGLASRPGEQTAADGAAATPTGFLVVGNTQRAGNGTVDTDALTWTSATGRDWTRSTLPSVGPASATRAACDTSGCVVAGNTATAQQHLLCWSIDPSGQASPAGSGPGHGLVQVRQVLTQPDRAYLLSDVDRVIRLDSVARDCTGWTSIPVPERAQDAALARLGDHLLLATTGTGSSRLWLREQG